MLEGINQRLITSAHDLSEGGLLVALLEMLFTDFAIGAEIKLNDLGSSSRLDALLFGESQGRALVGVSEENLPLTKVAEEFGVSASPR